MWLFAELTGRPHVSASPWGSSEASVWTFCQHLVCECSEALRRRHLCVPSQEDSPAAARGRRGGCVHPVSGEDTSGPQMWSQSSWLWFQHPLAST